MAVGKRHFIWLPSGRHCLFAMGLLSLVDYLNGEGKQSIASVRLSARLFPFYLMNRLAIELN